MKLDFIFKIGAVVRRAVFWLHLAGGTTAGAVILVMSASGALLAYQRQITAWADAMPLVTAPTDASRLPMQRILAAGSDAAGGDVSVIVFRSDAHAPVAVSAGRKAPVFLDPYTAAVVGRGSAKARSFFQSVTDWHRWLAMDGESRDTGRALTGAANLVFLFIVSSGIYLWWPRRWTRRVVSSATVPSMRLSGKARDFNWHNAVGFWSALPLLVVIPCGAVISYPWASDLVYRAFGEMPPKRAERSGGARESRPAVQPGLEGLDALLARTEKQMPEWNTITLRLPIPADGPVTFTIDQGSGARPDQRAQLTLDRRTGEVVRWDPYATLTPGRRARTWMRWAHTGEAAGIVGQTIAGLASAGAVVLVYTGLALAWRRLRAWRAASAAASVPATSLPLDPSIDSGGMS